MRAEDVTFGLAILAGLASFLSPCVLALVPAYIGYLGGRAVTTAGPSGEMAIESSYTNGRLVTFLHGLAFVLGFSVIFIVLGAAASALSQVLFDLREWIARIGGIIVVIFGLHVLGIIHLPFLDMDTRKQFTPAETGASFVSSFLMGVFFSAGWSACVGPVLGAVLTMAITVEGLQRAVFLLVGYSMGLAVPFLFAALFVGQATQWVRKAGKYMRYFQIANGILLIVLGVMLFMGVMERLAAFGFFIDFGI